MAWSDSACDQFFHIASEGDTRVSGSAAVAFFGRSGLHATKLAQLWTDADREHEGSLDSAGFRRMLRSVALVQHNLPADAAHVPLPSLEGIQLDEPSGTVSIVTIPRSSDGLFTDDSLSTAISDSERAHRWVEFCDLHPTEGKISGDKALSFFQQSQLPNAELAQIWALADMDKDGSLTFAEFCIAMHLTIVRLSTGNAIPATLSSTLMASANGTVSARASTTAPNAPIINSTTLAIMIPELADDPFLEGEDIPIVDEHGQPLAVLPHEQATPIHSGGDSAWPPTALPTEDGYSIGSALQARTQASQPPSEMFWRRASNASGHMHGATDDSSTADNDDIVNGGTDIFLRGVSFSTPADISDLDPYAPDALSPIDPSAEQPSLEENNQPFSAIPEVSAVRPRGSIDASAQRHARRRSKGKQPATVKDVVNTASSRPESIASSVMPDHLTHVPKTSGQPERTLAQVESEFPPLATPVNNASLVPAIPETADDRNHQLLHQLMLSDHGEQGRKRRQKELEQLETSGPTDEETTPSSALQLYDSAGGVGQALARTPENEANLRLLAYKRRRGCATLIFGSKLYIFGGQSRVLEHIDIVPVTLVERYDPTTRQWSSLPSLRVPRLGATVAAVGKTIYCIGGFDGQRYLNSVERFNPQLQMWEVISSIMK